MPETIQIPRSWLERLFEINDLCKNPEPPESYKEYDMLVHGYIESAKSLLE